MAEMVFVTDPRGALTYVSPASEHLLGSLPHEMIGHIFTEYMAEQEISRALALFHDTLFHNLSTRVIEFKFIKKNGSFFDGEVHYQYYQDNESSGMIGLIHDITERKQEEIFRKHYEHELQESQQFLASIYDAVNHSIFVVDVRPDGSFIFKGINPMHEKLTGYHNNDITGKTPEEILDPEVAKAVSHNYATCIREGKTIQYEEALPFLGKITWWETVLNPVRNDAGHIYRIIGTSKNITERKQAYAQLKKMSAAVEQSPAVVVITDPRGNIEYVNPMFTEHTGYSAEEARGKNPRILQSGLVPKALYKDLWNTILSGKVWRGELQNKKKNGELYWESVVIAAILNTEGVITNFVAVKEDITDQKKMLTDLIAAKEKAEESDRLKTAFLANISHEIRTPMNGILGFSELLKEPQLSGEEMIEYIDLIHQSGLRMLNLINDLIDISRIDAQETKLQITETPLNELLHNLHAFFKPEAEAKGLRLTCTTGLSDIESIIKTDSIKLNQILTNLIKNALKFTHKGGIDFGYTKGHGKLEFYVIDSGIGIPADMKDKIFERFLQVDNTLTRGYEGAGLGLSITKAFIEMLGGTIRVESIDGEGSKFFFTLDYIPAVSPETSQPPDTREKPAFVVPDLTILVAEDDEVSTLLLKKNLKGENITVLYAVNGEQAVDIVRHHPEINLVLMDIKMPLMNGYEATKLIKQLRPHLPVIAQTAFTSKEDRQKAKEAGCNSFITKPINKIELLELMNELLIH
jgi:PAS domain S-box-containing protein